MQASCACRCSPVDRCVRRADDGIKKGGFWDKSKRSGIIRRFYCDAERNNGSGDMT
jgi:hypothetical protein